MSDSNEISRSLISRARTSYKVTELLEADTTLPSVVSGVL